MNTIVDLTRVVTLICATILAVESCLAKCAPLELESPKLTTSYKPVVDQLQKDAFTGAIVVAHKGDDLFFAGFGDSATPNGQPDSNTLVDIGSITKTLTAVAALRLVDQGKLSMKDRIEKFFPHAPKRKLNITIHQLLTHSSGLPHSVAQDRTGISKDEFLKRTMDAELLFKPGEKFQYSNVGYSLIAAVIEQVSKTSFEGFVRGSLLKDSKKSSIGYQATYRSDRSILTPEGETISQNLSLIHI